MLRRHRREYWFRSLLVLLIVLGVGSIYYSVSMRGSTLGNQLAAWIPQGALRQQMGNVCNFGTNEVPGSFQVTAARGWREGRVLFFEVQCTQPGIGPQWFTGEGYLRWEWGAGWVFSSGSSGGPPFGAVGNQLTYSVTSSSDLLSSETLVLGRTVLPHVTAVEVTFADGRVQRDEPQDTVFMLRVGRDVSPCELRALDAAGRVVARANLSAHASIMRLRGSPPCP